MNKFLSITLLVPVFVLSACASIIQGRSDKVEVKPVGVSSASCKVKNGLGETSVVIPSSVEVRRSKTDLNINCSDQTTAASGNKNVESDIDAWVFGNILWGIVAKKIGRAHV